ncbi:unnamed protein product [Mytilus edulis]|uniref:Reverse transcriptase domain-containing protein n=1 Tax=Mytilus edulis TaxID=6550 RepID=A0A8S3TY49_MYTED|nr:unnamed protein product [Mytilus edulis]
MNVIQEVESEINEFISPIFVRPKKNGEYRMILNLKELNKHIEYQHFKMDSFESALIKENAYMSSVDLRHAYYSINIAEQHRKFLRFVWKEKYFQYSCLPNGIAMAPRLFTKIMKVVYASLRKMGYVNVGYIDDSLLLGDTELECKNNVTETVNMVSSLGFIVHKDKSVFTPKKCIKFLVEKQDTIAKECKQLQSKNKCKIREVARVLGILISSLPAVEFGKLYYRKIEREKIKALKLAMGDFDSEMFVTSEMKQDLKWWSDNIYTQKRKFNRGNPQVIIQTDASKLGWGAVLNEQKIGSRWSNDEKDNHINCLELLAVYYALKSFKDDLNTVENVKILTDNTTAVSYINSMGGIKSIECNRIARKIWIWCFEHQIWLIATHIPGKLNTKADYQSRNFNDQIEWQLNKNNFEKHDRTLCKEDYKRQGRRAVCGTTLANPTMVCSSNETVNKQSICYQSKQKAIDSTIQGHSSSFRKDIEFDGMSAIRNRLQNRGISEKTSTIIMASWRSGTQKQYKTYIKKWFIFCLERKEDKFHTSVELVLEFLTYLFECGLSYSALNSARSALSAFGLTFDNVPVGKHPLVIRFLKGVYHLRPTVHNDVNIWDVSIVLRLLRRLSPVADISVKDLTLKLVMLIALTNATRSQSIHLLKLSNMQKQKDCFRFKIFDLLKQSRPGYKNPEVILKSFPPDRRLCVYLVLKEYLKRTVDIRSEEDSLILSYIKPHKKVSCSTISRWIKSVMCRAGIDTSIFKAHSTRSASTSKAKQNNVPVSDILAKAGWSSSTTFGKFYDKTVTTSDVFAEKVLQI